VQGQTSNILDNYYVSLKTVDDRLEKRFAAFLREQRGELSYAKFGKKIGVAGSSLHWAESRQGHVSLTMVEKVARKLGASLEEIFGDLSRSKLGKSQP
jgi:DNA-binding XRE family transcriptional regulator